VKGESYVVDYRGNTNNTLVAGIGEQLHDGRLHPYPARGCNRRHSGQSDSGTPSVVIRAAVKERMNVATNRERIT